MAGFKCPFCGQFMSLPPLTVSVFHVSFQRAIHPPYTTKTPYLVLTFFKCPNDLCKKETVVVQGHNGSIDNRRIMVYPEAIYRNFPDYVPESIRQDYVEACMIRERSPKASATLSRRCLQGMIRDFWKVSGKRSLFDEIDAIKGFVPPSQWAAIDATRKIGNIGAHMEKDVNVVIDVEPDEADSLLKLIELLIDKWYIARHDEEELYSQITAMGNEKSAAKISARDHS